MWPVLVLAQCLPGAPCELPKGLPWYFGLVIGVLWLGVVVGALSLGRRLLRARVERRRDRRRADGRRAVERTTSGSEIERW